MEIKNCLSIARERGSVTVISKEMSVCAESAAASDAAQPAQLTKGWVIE